MKAHDSTAHFNLESHLPRLIALSLLTVLALLAFTGCQCQPGTSTAAVDPSGVYTLVSVDGQTVPCQLRHEGHAMTVKSGTFTINADGTCVSLSTFSVEGYRDVNREVKATYTQAGPKLTMRWQGAGTTTGEVRENTFTMNNESMIFTYRK